LLDLEEIEEEELDAFKTKYQLLAKTAREEILRGFKDTETPDA
jgi:hypothetical protein